MEELCDHRGPRYTPHLSTLLQRCVCVCVDTCEGISRFCLQCVCLIMSGCVCVYRHISAFAELPVIPCVSACVFKQSGCKLKETDPLGRAHPL